MKENYIVINGKKAELTENQLKALGIKEELPFDIELNDKYYYIDYIGEVGCTYNYKYTCDDSLIKVANACKDKELMQQRALKETLSRLLWRFSMENQGDKIDWSDTNQPKYSIFLNRGDFNIDSVTILKDLGEYFYCQKIARRAIDEIVKPFMEKHPDFVW